MDVMAIIKELRQELDRIDNLILALDALSSGRRRGRPPKLLQQLREVRSQQKDVTAAPKPRKRAVKKARKARASKKKAAATSTG